MALQMNNPLDQPTDPAQAVAAELLVARARALAREESTATADEQIDVLEFGLGEEVFAFELNQIREVLVLLELTPLPRVPPHILGITHVRGHILAVVDLRQFFGLPQRGLLNSWQLIVLQSSTMEFAVVAERIIGVRSLPVAALQTSLQTSLPASTETRATYLQGIAPDGTVVLSTAKLLADSLLIVQQTGS
jgi:purine-binding chemotaxis protein CheW